MTIKAIALDIDGTITDDKRKICIEAIKAIREAEEAGVPVILATGNVIAFTHAASTLIGSTGGLIAESGGVILRGVIDQRAKVEVLSDTTKPQKAYEYLKEEIGQEHKIQLVDDSDMRLSEIAMYRTMPADLVKSTLKDMDIEVYDTYFALHLTDPEINKATALKVLAKHHGIKTSQILAAGDSENDLDFLTEAGLTVAVNNATPEVKQAADYITTKPYGDGVAEAIRKFVL